jgi:signal peptidase I
MQSNVSRAVVAAVLQWTFFGAGYLRIGKWKRLFTSWAILVVGPLGVPMMFPVRSNPYSAPVIYFTIILVGFFCVWDVFRLSKAVSSQEEAPRTAWWKVVLYAATWTVTYAFISSMQPPLSSVVFGATSVRVTNLAMEPAVRGGDSVVVDTIAYRETPPAAGDVVAVWHDTSRTLSIARVSKVEGNQVGLELDNKAWVGESNLGTVPRADIRGRVASVWFSWDFSRIGTIVK